MAQVLDYLIFDYSEDEDGNGAWDAMVSVAAARLPALTSEIEALLQWAASRFPGRRGALEDGADWDYDLCAQDDLGQPLAASFDPHQRQLRLSAAAHGNTTVTLTLSGSPAFAQALRESFEVDGG